MCSCSNYCRYNTSAMQEKDSLMKANELLKKLGYKGDISASQLQQQDEDE